jgi:hypothetical protein
MRALTFHDLAFVRKLNTGGGGGGGSTVLLADLEAFWRFNEAADSDTAVDATGNGHTGAIYGANPPVDTGKIDGGRLCAFDQHFVAPDSAGFDFTSSDDWSAFGWHKITAGSDADCLFGLGDLGIYGRVSVPSDNYVRFHVLAGAITVQQAATIGDWAFWAVGYIASTNKGWLSVNGAARSYTSTYSDSLSSGRTATLGQMFGVGNVTQAIMDNVGVRRGLLNDAQIAWLWNGGTGRDITT